ncbi:MAG: tetratricopeptide repeat protein [Planctomycetota bacterium]
MRPLLLLLALCSSFGLARADVVVLTNGSKISGHVVEDGAERVVVKTPSGRVVLPRRMVKEVVRQSEGYTLLALADERVKAGALEEAQRLYEQAAKDEDPQVQALAKAGLARLEKRDAKVARYRKAPRWPYALPAGVVGEPSEGKDLQEQLDRARRALDDGDGRRAAALLAPMVAKNPEQPALSFLLGRAHELAREDAPARAAYTVALGRKPEPEWPLARVCELARRRNAGEDLARQPGWARGWLRAESERFAYYSRSEMEPSLVRQGEAAAQAVLTGLDLRLREAPLPGRLQVFVFEDGPSLGDARRAGLVEGRRDAPDGPLWVVAAEAARLEPVLRDAAAQALAEAAFPGLPEWARVGVAEQLSPETQRAERLKFARGRQLASLDDLLAGRAAPGKTHAERAAFRAQAGLVVGLIREQRSGLRQALKLCAKLADLGGPAKAFARFGVDLDRVRKGYAERLNSGAGAEATKR